MTESLNGGCFWSAQAGAGKVGNNDAPRAAPASVRPKLRRSSSELGWLIVSSRRSQEFRANVLEHRQGALHADFARKNRILVLHAEDSLVSDFHIRAHDFLPRVRAVAVTDGAESFRGQR